MQSDNGFMQQTIGLLMEQIEVQAKRWDVTNIVSCRTREHNDCGITKFCLRVYSSA